MEGVMKIHVRNRDIRPCRKRNAKWYCYGDPIGRAVRRKLGVKKFHVSVVPGYLTAGIIRVYRGKEWRDYACPQGVDKFWEQVRKGKGKPFTFKLRPLMSPEQERARTKRRHTKAARKRRKRRLAKSPSNYHEGTAMPAKDTTPATYDNAMRALRTASTKLSKARTGNDAQRERYSAAAITYANKAKKMSPTIRKSGDDGAKQATRVLDRVKSIIAKAEAIAAGKPEPKREKKQPAKKPAAKTPAKKPAKAKAKAKAKGKGKAKK